MKAIRTIHSHSHAAGAMLCAAALFLFPVVSGAGASLNVVTTHETLKSLVEEIGGDDVSVISIVRGAQDPHYAAAKPSFMIKARQADLWVRIGMQMEIGYERLILEGSRNRNIQVSGSGHLDAARNVMRLEAPTGQVDRSMGDVHPEGNPHYWLDPYNIRIVARDIAAKLSGLDPASTAVFQKNADAFIDRVDRAMFGGDAVDKLGAEALWRASQENNVDAALKSKGAQPGGWYAAMLPYRGRSIVTYHKSWIYFANRFGLRIPIEVEPKPGIPPGPGHTLKVIQTIKSLNVPLILVEPYYDAGAAGDIAEKAGAKAIVIANSVGGSDQAISYVAMMDDIVKKVSAGMSGK